MKLTRYKIFSFMLAAVFALTLAGCGGSGGGSAADDDGENGAVMECTAPQVGTYPDCTDPPPSDDDRIATARGNAATAATAARTAATTAAALPEAADTDTAAAIAAAETAATAAEAAKADADAATDPAVAEAAATAAETAQGDADTALATAMTASGAAVVAAADAEAAAKVVADTKAAGTKTTAIATEAGTAAADDDGPGGLAVDTDHMVAITRDRMDTKVTIAVDGAAADAPKFEEVMDLGVAEGFAGTMNLRAMEENDDGEVVEEVMVIRTDIKEPKATDFADVEMLDQETNDEAEGNDSLRIENANAAMLASSAFSASGMATITLVAEVEEVKADPDNNVEAVEGVEAFEADATFRGALGTVKCNGADASDTCSVTIGADGKITGATGDLDFTPADKAKIDVAQTDYLYYGIWLQRTKKDGATEYDEVEAFYGSNDLEASVGSQLNNVEGGADYKGNATGVYVKNVYLPSTSGEQKIDYATSGVFSADADLTVNFMGTSIPEDDHNTVTGSIRNFVLEKGEENTWSVALKGDRALGENTISGAANGGGAEGNFNGTLYGETPDTEADDDGQDKVAPGAVAGEFNANFSNGSVLGGFGAKKQ